MAFVLDTHGWACHDYAITFAVPESPYSGLHGQVGFTGASRSHSYYYVFFGV
jgi:hypothetical protein